MSEYKVIFFVIPIFLILMLIEWGVGVYRAKKKTGENTYRLNDTLASLSLGSISILFDFISVGIVMGLYALVYNVVGYAEKPVQWWSSAWGFMLALLIYDFFYYWFHRYYHEIGVLWAAHAVHHQSQNYNLSTALRQPSSYNLFKWIFYLPLALMGVPLVIFVMVGLVNLLYQFWVHTEQIKKLGWFDRVFCSPSNHRVHHGVNAKYIDKNYGGILVIWDRIFGTFQEEEEKVVFGTMSSLESWDPVWANTVLYQGLFKYSWVANSWWDKVKVWIMPPGWQPADVAQKMPYPPFEIEKVRTFDPALTRAQIWLCFMHFVAVLACFMTLLWNLDGLTRTDGILYSLALVVVMWGFGAYMGRRINLIEFVAINVGAVAMLSGIGLAPESWFVVLKPLAVLLLVTSVIQRISITFENKALQKLLALGLFFGALGDYTLTHSSQTAFMVGLAFFLISHIFYLTLFKKDSKQWFSNRLALSLLLIVGGIFYAYMWRYFPHDNVLRIAVAVYMVFLLLMTAQAIGRFKEQGDSHALWVAIGAGSFVISDVLVAWNAFHGGVAYYNFVNLFFYYSAQLLFAHHVGAVVRKPK